MTEELRVERRPFNGNPRGADLKRVYVVMEPANSFSLKSFQRRASTKIGQ